MERLKVHWGEAVLRLPGIKRGPKEKGASIAARPLHQFNSRFFTAVQQDPLQQPFRMNGSGHCPRSQNW